MQKSKFQQQSDSDEGNYNKQPQQNNQDQGQNIKSKFQQNSDSGGSDNEKGKQNNNEQEEKKQSKYQVQSSDDENQKKQNQPEKQSKFMANNSDDDETNQPNQQQNVKSKFQQNDSDEETNQNQQQKVQSKFQNNSSDEDEQIQQNQNQNKNKNQQNKQNNKKQGKNNKQKKEKKPKLEDLDEEEFLKEMQKQRQQEEEIVRQQQVLKQEEENKKKEKELAEKLAQQANQLELKQQNQQISQDSNQNESEQNNKISEEEKLAQQEKKKKKKDKDKEKKKNEEKEKPKEPKQKVLTDIQKRAIESRKQKEEDERIKKEYEDEQNRLAEEEEKKQKEEEEAAKLLIEQLKQDRLNQIKEGKILDKKQIKAQENRRQLQSSQIRSLFEQQKDDEKIKSELLKWGINEDEYLVKLVDSLFAEREKKALQFKQKQESDQAKKDLEARKLKEAQELKEQQQLQQAKEEQKEEIPDDWDQLVEENDNQEIVQQQLLNILPQMQGKKKKSSQQIDDDDAVYNPYQPLDIINGQNVMRSPIICILGHVDTGKTTLLDKLRNTHVQEGEAGGITQQIGATFFPGKKISEEILKCAGHYKVELKTRGILAIDTPGHETFSNLRSRGSGLCDFAILVIDLMHGLENQTKESMQLLRDRKTPFVIALNKIDKCYGWKSKKFESSYITLSEQSSNTKNDFENRYQQVITQLAEQSFNAELYWKEFNPREYVPIVPTSGVTGEGIPDLMAVIVKYTQYHMKNKLVMTDNFNCTIMEVKMIEGLGTTIDCILIDGQLKVGDHIILLGFDGPIKTRIRTLLTPEPMKEMRVKNEYIQHKIIYASMGLKIAANGLENAVAGSMIYLANTPEEEEYALEEVSQQLEQVKQKVKLVDQGVGVIASTLGSLEALLMFLQQENIPVSYVSVGPVSKEDVTKAMKSLLADDVSKRKKEFAVMLVFDVKVLQDAQQYAEQHGVKIFMANIIYHLCDQFKAYVKEVVEERRLELKRSVIFPSIIKPIEVFNKKQPMIIGVEIEEGILKPGTVLCICNEDKTKVGIVESIEANNKSLQQATKLSGQVAIKIKDNGNIIAGKTFVINDDRLISVINRSSIDCLKEFYKDDLSKEDWKLVKKLKDYFQII